MSGMKQGEKKNIYFSAVKRCTAFSQVTETRVNFQKTDGYKPL